MFKRKHYCVVAGRVRCSTILPGHCEVP